MPAKPEVTDKTIIKGLMPDVALECQNHLLDSVPSRKRRVLHPRTGSVHALELGELGQAGLDCFPALSRISGVRANGLELCCATAADQTADFLTVDGADLNGKSRESARSTHRLLCGATNERRVLENRGDDQGVRVGDRGDAGEHRVDSRPQGAVRDSIGRKTGGR